jgi:hypothetical protein
MMTAAFVRQQRGGFNGKRVAAMHADADVP